MSNTLRPAGMLGFTVVWIGQLISLMGTNMASFAITIWAYQRTGRATDLALIGVFFMVPLLAMSPIAGALVDRSNRKFMMMISDLAAGLTTVLILVLFLSGRLEIWHLYLSAAIQGTFQTFQWPAYSAAISTMLPKKQYARANGMLSLAESGSGVFAPLLAGALLGLIGFAGVLIVDIVTFTFAVGTLLFVHIPQPAATRAGEESRGSLLKESVYGFRYILKRPSLLGLQLVFLSGNFLIGMAFTVMAPMILARTDSNELIFGSVQSAGAVGGLAGGLMMSAWGGPRRLVHGVLGGWAVASLLGGVTLGLGRSLPLWAVGAFVGTFFVPIINGSNQAIWQAKVAPDVQGRVFAIRRLIAWVTSPLSRLIAGPLADFVLEPAMHQGGSLAGLFGSLVGTGPGAGMSLLILVSSLGAMLVGLAGYAFPAVRYAEDLLPDHEAASGGEGEKRLRVQALLETRRRLIAEPATPEQARALKEISRELRELGRQDLASPVEGGR